MKDKSKEHRVDEFKNLTGLNAPPKSEPSEPNEFLGKIIEHIPEGVAVVNAQNLSILMMSEFGLELMGRSKEKIEGTPWPEVTRPLEVFHADGLTRAKSEELPLIRAIVKGEVIRNEEWVVKRPDGKKLNFLCNSGPIRDRHGNLVAGIMVWRDITELRLSEEKLHSNFITARKDMEEQLQAKSNRLLEVNSALKVLLRQRDEDRKEFEEAVLTNIENLIMPYVRRMKSGPLSDSQASLLEILESHLKELTSKFGKTLALQYRVLTPTEMRVAALVRDGKTSKEIADVLCICEKTASFHRNNIRTKLGLRGMGANLRSHLLTLA
jgi:PAS domain S-box-containing protein